MARIVPAVAHNDDPVQAGDTIQAEAAHRVQDMAETHHSEGRGNHLAGLGTSGLVAARIAGMVGRTVAVMADLAVGAGAGAAAAWVAVGSSAGHSGRCEE